MSNIKDFEKGESYPFGDIIRAQFEKQEKEIYSELTKFDTIKTVRRCWVYDVKYIFIGRINNSVVHLIWQHDGTFFFQDVDTKIKGIIENE